MVGAAATIAAVRHCYGVITHVRRAGGPEPDVTLAE
jgi:hypothetical protein